MLTRPLIGLFLAAVLASGSRSQNRECDRYVETPLPGRHGLHAGTYRLTLVATEGTRRHGSSTGTLWLWPTSPADRSPRTGRIAADTDTVRTPLWGATDADFRRVGAPVFESEPGHRAEPSPRSRDPVYPGVLVLSGQEPVDSGTASATLLIGTLSNRRDGTLGLDGAGIALWVRAANATALKGSWSEWGEVADGRGYVCLWPTT